METLHHLPASAFPPGVILHRGLAECFAMKVSLLFIWKNTIHKNPGLCDLEYVYFKKIMEFCNARLSAPESICRVSGDE